MTNYLVVPIYLDALVLNHPTPVVEAFVDFSRLPYSNRESDVHPDIPNISEEILSQPFQNQNLYLGAGIHLHWSLPDALTVGKRDKKGKTEFPAVPNRWLVTRMSNRTIQPPQWVVESDYLDPERGNKDQVAYPFANTNEVNSSPFRYMGRCLTLDKWLGEKKNPPNSYLNKLTAVGYGEPAFAAFYPNCHSIFGFFDGDILGDIPDDITDIKNLITKIQTHKVVYEVLGWYSNSDQDYLSKWIKNYCTNNNNGQPSLDEQVNDLSESNHWVVSDNVQKLLEQTKAIDCMVCYAQIKFEEEEKLKKEANISVAIGNTSTEALSAYLATQLDSNNKTIIEDQLEALHLAAGLEHRKLDIGPKFRGARHTKGFRPVSAGSIWTLRLENETPENQTKAKPEQMTLPLELAKLLNDLNDRQQAYDRAWQEIESLQQQLFADWYKYMLCAYPPLDAPDDYPDIDEVKHFIEVNDLKTINQKIKVTGFLGYKKNDAVGQPILISQIGQDLAAQVASSVNTLLDSDAMSEPQKLVRSDIPDWSVFLAKLRQSTILALVPKFLEDKKTLEDREQQIDDIVKEINDRLSTKDFYLEIKKNESILSENTKDILKSLKDSSASPKRVWLRLNRLLLESLFPEHIAHRPNYVLKNTHAPRYWEPTDPVVLITGDLANPTGRHGTDGELHKNGLLTCSVVKDEKSELGFDSKAHLDKFRERINTQGKQDWKGQPWNPIMLEWEVEFFPAQEGSNIPSNGLTYAENFIETNYCLPDSATNLCNIERIDIVRGANVYSGRVILTPHAKNQLRLQLEHYLESLPKDDYHQFSIDLDEQSDLPKNLDSTDDGKVPETLIDQFHKYNESLSNEASKRVEQNGSQWTVDNGDIQYFVKRKSQKLNVFKYTKLPNKVEWGDPIFTAIKAYIALQDETILAQALGGFNQALLMHKQTFQLPIADPIGFDDYKGFSDEDTCKGIENNNRSAPQPLNDFNPIRAGEMKILRLRLIDTFGQVREIDCEDKNIITSDTMGKGSKHPVRLPPRLSQPARLNFRWLAAEAELIETDEAEMNDHPATSPVCGWILPNNLDGSLMFYEQSGRALGSLDQNGTWHAAPGQPRVSIEKIQNKHLQKLITYLIDQNKKDSNNGFLAEFLNTLENALENIDPENFVHNEALALLMGRPIAVVRASLNLELRGMPAVHQGWNVFRQDLGRDTRDTNGFTRVKFPIRIGEFEQLNDGLLGYWVEDGEHNLDEKFCSPQKGNPSMIKQSIDDPPHTLTMLLDPRGVVHATCGILPTKAIQIPPDQFAEALRNIEVTFLTAPILTDVLTTSLPVQGEAGLQQSPTDFGKVHLPLPEVEGYEWSWLEKENGTWVKDFQIVPVSTQATFAARQELREGWLKLRKSESKNNGKGD